MVSIVHESEVAGLPAGLGGRRQPLLSAARVPGSGIVLDRLSLAPGGDMMLAVPATGVAWIQPLEGETLLFHAGENHLLTEAQVAVLPPGFAATLTSARGAVLLYGEVLAAGQVDSTFVAKPPPFQLNDWTREPVLDSEHDARKRIYLVTPKLFATKAVKGEIIIYPPGTAAAEHHHEGAEHFMYVLRGRGTVYANGQPFPVRKGDVIHYPDRERHYLEAAPDDELVFAEFFTPADFKTVWVDDSKVCAWLPTGRDIRGRIPSREIKAHSVAAIVSPDDV